MADEKSTRTPTRFLFLVLKILLCTLVLLSWLATLNRMGKISIGRTALPIETIRKESGFAALSQPFPAEVTIRDLDVRLAENGVEIRRDPLSTSDSVREEGGGEFMIWNDGTILFSATDSSDPTANGRVYAITLPKILPKRTVKIVYAATFIAAFLLALASVFRRLHAIRAIFRGVHKNRRIVGAILLAVLPFLILSVKLLLPQSLWCDEIYTLKNYVIASDALNPAVFYDYPNNHVLFNLFLARILRIFGMQDFAAVSLNVAPVRAATLVFPALSLVFSALAAGRFGKTAVLLAPLLLATSLPFYAWSVELRGYGLSMALMSMLIYFVLSVKTDRARFRFWAIAILTAMLIYTIPFNAIFIGGIMLVLGVDWLTNLLKKDGLPTAEKAFHSTAFQMILAFLAGIALAVLWYYPILDQVIRVYAPGGYHQPTSELSPIQLAQRMLRNSVGHLAYALIGKRPELLAISALGIVGAALSWRKIAAEFRDLLRYTLSTLLLLIGFCALSGYVPFNRNLLPLVPQILLIVAVAFAALLDQIRKNELRIGLTLMAAVLVIATFSVEAERLNRSRPAYAENSLDQIAAPYFISAFHAPNRVFAYIRETYPDAPPLIFPLPADFYEYEMCESFGLTCYPDYVGPDAPRVLSEGGPYFMIETDWCGESAPPISRAPYADDCVPDEEFAARFADLTLYTLYRCR